MDAMLASPSSCVTPNELNMTFGNDHVTGDSDPLFLSNILFMNLFRDLPSGFFNTPQNLDLNFMDNDETIVDKSTFIDSYQTLKELFGE